MKDEGEQSAIKTKNKFFRIVRITNTWLTKRTRTLFPVQRSAFHVPRYSLRPPCTNTSRGLPASAAGAIRPSRSIRSIMRAARL